MPLLPNTYTLPYRSARTTTPPPIPDTPPPPSPAPSGNDGDFPSPFYFLEPPDTDPEDEEFDGSAFEPLWTHVSSCEAGAVVRVSTVDVDLDHRVMIIMRIRRGTADGALCVAVYKDYAGDEGDYHWPVIAVDDAVGSGDGGSSPPAARDEEAEIGVLVAPQWEGDAWDDTVTFGIFPSTTVDVGTLYHADLTTAVHVLGRVQERSMAKLHFGVTAALGGPLPT